MRIELLMNGSVMHGCDRDEIRGELSIGRSSACNWAVPKDQIKVSSKHAVLAREGGAVVFRDLDSTNGSYLRGERITRHLLKPGDEIHFGDCVLRLAGVAEAAGKARHPRLRIRSGPLSGQTYVLTKPGAVIGSDASAEVSIRDPMLSKRHAVLSLGPDGWSIKDLGSTNGTFVDGQRLENGESRPLGRKGQFHLAHHGFAVESPGANRRAVLLGALAVTFALAVAATAALLLPPGDGKDAPAVKPPAGDSPAGGSGEAAGPSPSATGAHWAAALDANAPDFTAIRAAAKAGTAEERAAVEELAAVHTRWAAAEARLAAGDTAGFTAAAGDTRFATTVAALKPWVTRLEARRADLTRLATLAADLPPRLVALGRPPWETPDIIKHILAVDALSVAPAADAAPEGGAYGEWLGAQTTFRQLFEAAGKISLAPLPSSPGTPRVDQWKAWLDAAAEADAIASRHALPAGPLAAQIDLLRTTRKGRDAFVRGLLADAAQAPGRTGLVEAVLASRLADDPAKLELDGQPLAKWIKTRFSEVLDASEALQTRLDAAPESERAALRAELLRTGLPGDSLVNRAWREGAAP